MATKPVTAKLRLRLELIAALPEPILLDRLRRLSVAELILFRRFYGILAARLARELRNNPPSMYQTRCQCAACRQPIPPVPFAVHQLLAQRLVPKGETAPRLPRTRPNRNRKLHAA